MLLEEFENVPAVIEPTDRSLLSVVEKFVIPLSCLLMEKSLNE